MIQGIDGETPALVKTFASPQDKPTDVLERGELEVGHACHNLPPHKPREHAKRVDDGFHLGVSRSITDGEYRPRHHPMLDDEFLPGGFRQCRAAIVAGVVVAVEVDAYRHHVPRVDG